jgi:hypothetical protein
VQTRTRNANQRRRLGARSARPTTAAPRPTSPTASLQEIEDLRDHPRYAVAESFLRVVWLDAKGDPKIENSARPIDVSETGMAVELPDAALLLSRIRLESDKGELLGQGKVRYCRPQGTKYIVGVEFTDSLRWSPPEGPINGPIPLSAPESEEELTPDGEPDSLSDAPTERLEELLWCETPDDKPLETEPTAIGPKETKSADMVVPHWSLGSRVDQGFLARLPMAVKAGAPVLLVLLLGAFLMAHSGSSAASSTGGAPTSNVGEQGWVTEWASDAAGSRRGRQITLYRPSVDLSDYQMQFTGQIESKALGWVFRAKDTKNYYGMKIENDKGSVMYTRFAVVHGKESSVTQKRLPIQARVDTSYNVKLEVRGPRFSVYIQGEPVELWTDSRLKAGALGFMNEADERGRTNSVRFAF